VAKRRHTLKCPVCKIEVKAGRLDAHIAKVHPDAGAGAPRKGKSTRKAGKSELFLAVAVAAVVLVAAVGIYYFNQNKGEENTGPDIPPVTDNTTPRPTQFVRITVAQFGEITIGLYGNETPKTVKNFQDLVASNFFTGTIFHRIIKNFMIQGGGYTPEMQLKPVPFPPINLEINSKLHNVKYTVSMARTSDPNSATTQFFINTGDNRESLDPRAGSEGYTVFGVVVKGMDVVDRIAAVNVEDGWSDNQPSKPTQDEIPRLIISNTMMIDPPGTG
jgi:cyclophilin family peptidyl-prolyl cis-trans isomerase